MRFHKMHGLGNDYVVLGFRGTPQGATFECEGASCPVAVDYDFGPLAVKLCNRCFGIGADGLIAVMPSETCDFRMRIFNSDGTEAEMCGNGSRCATKYYIENLMPDALRPPVEATLNLSVQTMAGKKAVSSHWTGDMVDMITVNMGQPILDPALIPVDHNSVTAVDIPIHVGGKTYFATCVSMGNPHAVIYMLDDIDEFDISIPGPLIEKHPMFPKKTNVEFYNVISDEELKMRVWERGVGETLACGTGACATLVAANLTDRAGRSATLHLRGGDLRISMADSDEILMTGPAETVFIGKISDDYLK